MGVATGAEYVTTGVGLGAGILGWGVEIVTFIAISLDWIENSIVSSSKIHKTLLILYLLYVVVSNNTVKTLFSLLFFSKYK